MKRLAKILKNVAMMKQEREEAVRGFTPNTESEERKENATEKEGKNTRSFPGYKVRDLALAGEGREALRIAKSEMPGMVEMERRFEGQQPLKGARIAGCLHMTVQTAVMVELLATLGADIAWCSSNVLSTEDKAAAALVDQGISVYAWKGETEEEYQWCLEAVLCKWKEGPNLVMDDGGDLSTLLHGKYARLLPGILGQTEQTTTGTRILKEMDRRGDLMVPAICINESVMKSKFDNVYGCRESLIDGIKRATDVMIAGKRVHICGYGDVGKGCAQSMARMGAVVTVSEIDPVCAMQAAMEGYQVRRVDQVREEVDIWVTATGNRDIITGEDMLRMKDMTILSNIGHFNVEVDAAWIYASAREIIPIGGNAERIVLPNGKSVILLAQGRLVNLGCATGHPSFVMSMSFSCQTLAALRLWRTRGRLVEEGYSSREGRIFYLTQEEDEDIARMHLHGLGHSLTALTPEQERYSGIPATGPFKPVEYRY